MSKITLSQLRKIIKSSERIRSLKKRFGLSPDAYIRQIIDRNFYVDANECCPQEEIASKNKDKPSPKGFKYAEDCVLIKEVEGKSAWDFYCEDVLEEIDKIIKHFELDISADSLRKQIFWGSHYPFQVLQPKPDQIIIDVFDDLDKEQVKYLLERVERKLEIRRMFVEAKKNIKISRQNKTIYLFDDVYVIAKKYERIRNSGADRKTKAKEKELLLEDAKKILKKKSFTIRDLDKVFFNFKKQFGKVC